MAGLQCIAGIISALGCSSIDWGEFCVPIFSFYEEVSAMQIGFYDKEIIQRERHS
jgi:hypothetical protein